MRSKDKRKIGSGVTASSKVGRYLNYFDTYPRRNSGYYYHAFISFIPFKGHSLDDKQNFL
jgi:hypothetical protein